LVSPAWVAEISQTPEETKVTTPRSIEHTVEAPAVIEIVGVSPDELLATGEYVEPVVEDDGILDVKERT
jgi:hypothetical protein